MNNGTSQNAANGRIIRVEGLCREYPDGAGVLPVLQDIHLEVHAGEMVAITGPSGSGKSTLLFILGLLLRPSRGLYWLLGEEVQSLDRGRLAALRRQKLGFVFQSCDLIEHSTVSENLEFPLMYAGVDRSRRPELIAAALARVNLSHRLHQRTNRLSGGEQQRVAVARALVNRPRLILADEPTGHLDQANGRLVMAHFQEFVHSGPNAVIIVTHDPAVAACCQRVLSLKDGRLT